MEEFGFKVLRGTYEDWQTYLAKYEEEYGEPYIPEEGKLVAVGFEDEQTGEVFFKLKIGNGNTEFNDLPYTDKIADSGMTVDEIVETLDTKQDKLNAGDGIIIETSTGPNMFNIEDSFKSVLTPTGTTEENQDYITSNYIKVKANTTYVISNNYRELKEIAVALYDTDKHFIEYKSNTGTAVNNSFQYYRFNATQDGYLRFTVYGTNTKIMLNKGTTYLPYEDYVEIENTISAVGGSSGGNVNYHTNVTGKPKINGVELDGNKTSSDLGLASLSNTYTKTEVDNKVNEKSKVWYGDDNPFDGTALGKITIGTDYEGIKVGDFYNYKSSKNTQFPYIKSGCIYQVIDIDNTYAYLKNVENVYYSSNFPPEYGANDELISHIIADKIFKIGSTWYRQPPGGTSSLEGYLLVDISTHFSLGSLTLEYYWTRLTSVITSENAANSIALRSNFRQALMDDEESSDALAGKEYVDEELDDKQDKLTPGTNITIVDNVISASCGGNPITDTAKGSTISLTDSAESPLDAISIMGKSTQNGTPSIDNPVPIVDITSEQISITDGTNTQTANLTKTLRGIPVSSGGNYTDNNNQQWLCDTIERYADGTGKYIQRVANITLNGTEEWRDSTNGRVYERVTDIPNSTQNAPTTLFSHFSLATSQQSVGTNDNTYIINNGNLVISPTQNGTRLTASQWATFLETSNATIYYPLATPIETPLTSEELAELELDTYYPTTNISSNADVTITYVADTKNYIDKRMTELQNAIISQGGNV